MSSKNNNINNPRNLWDLVNKKANKPVDKEVIQDIAKGVNSNIQNDSDKMRQLVKQLTTALGIKLTPEKEADIMKYLSENKFTGIDSINKLLKK